MKVALVSGEVNLIKLNEVLVENNPIIVQNLENGSYLTLFNTYAQTSPLSFRDLDAIKRDFFPVNDSDNVRH